MFARKLQVQQHERRKWIRFPVGERTYTLEIVDCLLTVTDVMQFIRNLCGSKRTLEKKQIIAAILDDQDGMA